jgi:hypothetical protein
MGIRNTSLGPTAGGSDGLLAAKPYFIFITLRHAAIPWPLPAHGSSAPPAVMASVPSTCSPL